MTIWYDENGQRRGVLSAADFQAAVSTIPKRRVGLLLAALVTANGATVNSGTYTGVLVKAT